MCNANDARCGLFAPYRNGWNSGQPCRGTTQSIIADDFGGHGTAEDLDRFGSELHTSGCRILLGEWRSLRRNDPFSTPFLPYSSPVPLDVN